VRYIQAPAEDTGLSDRAFHVVTCCQSWGWFERARAASEAMRVLRPDGMLALISYDWLPRPGSVCAATEELIASANPAWMQGGGTGLHADWPGDLMGAGFIDIESFSFDVEVPFSREAWRGRARASSGIAASLDAEAVARFDDALRLLLEDRFPAEPVKVMHRIFVCAGRRPAPTEDRAHEVR
jgi:SAM-dependent methyltransferase